MSSQTSKALIQESRTEHMTKARRAPRPDRRGSRVKSRMALSAVVLASTASLARADKTWNGGGPSTDTSWTTALNWIGGLPPAPNAGEVLTFDGFAKTSNTNNFAAGSGFGGLVFASTAGAFTLTGNQLTLQGDIVDNTTLLTQTINLPLLLDANRNVNVADNALLTIGGPISDNGNSFGLTKIGNGALTLSGTNTFAGAININAGVLSVSNANQLGLATATAPLTINGGTLRVTGAITIPSVRSIVLGPAGGSGAGTFDINTNNTATFGGVISNGAGGVGSLDKLHYGTLILSGANTYTGSTNILNGRLVLNFADAAAPLTNIISASSQLTLGGATAAAGNSSGIGQESNASLIMTGKASANNVQTFAGTNINTYGSVIQVTPGASGTAKLNLGALTHTLGGTVVIPTNAGTITTTTNVATTHGILGAWAIAGTPNTQRGITFGSDWATVGPDNGDGTHNIIPYTAYVTAPLYNGAASTTFAGNAAIAANADKNLLFTGPGSAAEMRVDAENANSTTDINTLAFTTSGQNYVLTIGQGNTLRLGQYGGIFKKTTGNNQIFIGGTGGSTFNAGTLANAGHLTAGGAPNTPGELVITLDETANNSGCITIVSDIVNNGTGAVTVIKNSVASAKIDGHGFYTGGTYVNQGRLQYAGSEQLRMIDPNDPLPGGVPSLPLLTMGNPDGLGTGPVYVAPGAYLFVSGVNGTGTFTGNGAIPGARPNTAQNAPIVNDLFIAGNGTSQEAGGAIRLGGRAVLKGTVTLTEDTRVNAGNAQAYPAINPDGVTVYFDPGNEFSGRITGPGAFDIGGRAVAGANFVISNHANDWSGTTTILPANGTARLRLGNNEVIPDGAGKGNLQFGDGANSAILDMQGYSETVNGLSTATSTNLAGAIVENNGFTPTIVDPTPADKTDDNQSYSFTAGVSTLTVGGFDQTATFGGTIRDSDTGASVTLPNPNFEGPTDPEGDPATISVTAPWVTGGAKVAFTKIGAGIQTLSGANTYSGDTNINGGTLNIANPGSLLNTGVVKINNGGALSGTGSVGAVTLNSGGVISPGDRGLGNLGSITLASLNAPAGGKFSLDLGAGTLDVVNVTGNATLSGAFSIDTFGVPTAGTYTFVNASTVNRAGATFTITPPPQLFGTRPASVTFNGASPANQLQLIVIGGAKTLTWTGSTNSNWELVGASNWTGEGTTQQFFNGDLVSFLDGPTNRNVNLVGTLSPGTILVNNSQGNDYTFSGTGFLSGGGGLFKDGAGTLTINTANNYSGQTTVNNGELLVLANTATTGTIQINGGSVQVGNGGTSGSLGTSPVNTGGNGLFFTRSDAYSVASAIGGGGQVFVNGTGTATFSGNNSFSGDLNILSGKVIANNSNSLGSTTGGSVQITAGAALDISGNTTANNLNFGTRQIHIRGAGPDGTGAIVNNGVSQQNAFQNITLEANATIGGTARFDLRNANSNPNLNLNNHTLTKLGIFQFSVVGGGDINSGTIDVQAGTLSIETTTNAPGGDLSSGQFIFRDGTALQFSAEAGNIERPMLFNGNTTIGTNGATASLVASNLTFDGPLTFTAFANTATLSLTGNITELNGPRSLTKNGGGILALSGATAGWTGTTTINAGTLQLGTDSNTSAGSLGTGAVIDNANLVFNRGDTVSYPNAISGSGALFKTGFGTVTLAGNLSYTGPTGVSNGTLILTSGANTQSGVTTLDNGNLVLAHSLAAQNSTINLMNDNHLIFDGTVTSATIGGLAGPGNLNLVNQASAPVNLTIKGGGGSSTVGYAGAITGAGTVTKIGAGTQVFSGNNNYAGATQVQGGSLVLLGDNPRNVIFNNAGADITGGKLVFDFSTGTDPTSQVVGLLTTGFNQSPTKFATGPLRTSAATADKGLGYSTAIPSQIAVFYTYYGDANGDGTVNMLDFNALATNFGGSGKGWSDGNFDYNATVNSADFNLLAGNFNKSLPVTPAPVLGTLVPEPASLGLVGIGLLAGLARRRRR